MSNHGVSESDELHIIEDLVPRKRRVSLSSCDSEPIPKQFRSDDVSSSDEECVSPAGAIFSLEFDSNVDDEDAGETIPLDQVSEAHIAVVSSVSQQSASLIAEVANGAYIVDVGTRLCLENGTYVGSVASIFGPVKKAFFAVKLRKNEAATLMESGTVKPGCFLHYDLVHHRILFNPALQCDTTAGTDASYLNDEELPENVRPDFSDDEKEKLWIQEIKQTTGRVEDDDHREEINATNQLQPSVIVPPWLQ